MNDTSGWQKCNLDFFEENDMTDNLGNELEDLLGNIVSMSPEEKAAYRKIAGNNLGRIRNKHFPNKLSAMAAMLQEGKFRDTLNPVDLERQLRRWISEGLPLENIKGIARALKIPASEFFNTTDLSPINSPMAHQNGEEDELPGIPQIVSSKNGDQSCENSLEGGLKHSLLRKSGLWNSAAATLLVAIIIVIYLFINNSAQESVIVLWPKIVDTHSEYVSGKLINFSKDRFKEADLKLFVKPVDGDNKYWLNQPPYPPILTEDSVWYQKCRFGDEDIRTMKKAPPLRFDIYAVVLKKGAKLPLNSKNTYIEAASETDFFHALEPYASSVSEKFSLTRVAPAEPEIPIVIGLTSPVKITWGERVPMYIEIYHGGKVIKDGYHSSGELFGLSPSPILYEIKMSRKKGHHQNNTWILVENE
jgi:hypothetical protein